MPHSDLGRLRSFRTSSSTSRLVAPRELASKTTAALLAIASAGALGCTSVQRSAEATTEANGATSASADPKSAEVGLEARAGWNATLVIDQGKVGIWTVGVLKVFPYYGCDEIVGIDDLGRCHVLWSYSGKWTPSTTIADGEWLGGLALADVDARVPGKELYTGSQQGNLYQVVPHENAWLDHRRVARIPGFEIHTVVAADVDAAHAGEEVLVFTSPGAVYLATPRTDRDGFELKLLGEIEGRVRDALVLPARAGTSVEIATVGRHGKLEILRVENGQAVWTTVFDAPMGLGRIALRKSAAGEPLVLYSTADDGMVRRHERATGGAWKHETVYAGPQGPRGLCAGRFDADPSVETIAVFGYSAEIELLSRRAGDAWSATTIFEDRDKGHWITTGELDQRNGTDELVASGYGGRIVLLSRPPGHGLSERGAAVVDGGR